MAYSITLTNNTDIDSFVDIVSPESGETINVYVSEIDGLTINDNDNDVTNSFSQITSISVRKTANSYTSAGKFSGSGISCFSNAVGYTAESPQSTSTSNAYASSGSTSTITYSFDFSEIPVGATITSVSVKVYGGAESATYSSSKKCEVQLLTNSTAKGTAQHFTSTSNSIMTISNPGSWTRSELQNAKLRATIGYYGGRIRGITWTVNYNWQGYKYTISSVSTNHVIVIDYGSTDSLYIQNDSQWIKIQKVYVKTNGAWNKLPLEDVEATFNGSTKYVVKYLF